MVQVIDDIEEPEYAEILAFIPHEETEEQEELVSGKGSKKRKPAAKASTSKTVAQLRTWDPLQVAGDHGRKSKINPLSNFYGAVDQECIELSLSDKAQV